jgi:effector-binding domain-containing protein
MAHSETADFAGPPVALYLDDEYREKDIHVEAACPVTGQLPETEEVKVRLLPEVAEMACVEHRGPFDGLRGAFDALLHWIEANNYTINGPGREVYVQFHQENDPTDWITEVQFPVVKR